MKKLLMLLCLFGSCTLFDINVLSPPDWIMGTWADESGYMAFTFTESNCTMFMPGLAIDFTAAFKSTNLTDNNSGNRYTISITEPEMNAIYNFVQINSNSFSYTNTVNGLSVGPLAFYRR